MLSNDVRLVLDTNTAISGLLWGGMPGRLIDATMAGHIELAATAALLSELQGVLLREKFAGQLAKRGLTVGDVFDGYSALVCNGASGNFSAPALWLTPVLENRCNRHAMVTGKISPHRIPSG